MESTVKITIVFFVGFGNSEGEWQLVVVSSAGNSVALR